MDSIKAMSDILQPNRDEERQFVTRNDVWQLWKDMGMDTESFVDFAIKLYTFCQADRTHTLQAKQYTRLEVIDHTDQGTGREYSKWVATPFTVKFDEQDDGLTLKIFINDYKGDE